MIAVTAPTGHIGSRVVSNLLRRDEAVRVIVRDPDRLPAGVADRVEVVVGSHRDRDVVDRAFEGADSVFWLVPADRTAPSVYDAYVSFSIPAADAIVRHGVSRVVTVSALGRGQQRYAGFVSASLAMDDLLRSTGVHLRALTMPSFMDNLLRQVQSICDDGLIRGTTPGDLKAPLVDTRDIAAVASRLLLDHTWTGQDSLGVLGPEDLSPNDMAVEHHPHQLPAVGGRGAQACAGRPVEAGRIGGRCRPARRPVPDGSAAGAARLRPCPRR